MATTMNDGKEHFTKNNVLICWNGKISKSGVSYADQLIAEGYSVVTSYADFKKKEKEFTTTNELNQKPDKRKTKKDTKVEDKITGLVVLCELTWGLGYKNQNHTSSLHAMSGIDFVMELRKNNCILPIVLVSFLSREQQLTLTSRNDIISTPILGHYYLQLPSDPYQWIETLNFSGKNDDFKEHQEVKRVKKELSDIELEDVKSHFCDPKGMLSELNHDLRKYLDSTKPFEERNDQFEYVFKKIRDIVGPASAQVLEENRSLNHDTDKEYEKKIKSVSASIEELIKTIKTQFPAKNIQTNKYKVIFLDDEMYIDPRLKQLVETMDQNGFDVQKFTDPDEAFKIVKADVDNLIDLIISDHRIWNQEEKPKLMNQLQGYSFLLDCSGLQRTYTYVVFSALPRNFLMTNFDLNTKTLYKNGVLANESSMLNFIHNLYEWGDENKRSIASGFTTHKTFIKCYNWYRDNNDKAKLDSQIDQLTEPVISKFKEIKKRELLIPINANSSKRILFPDECNSECDDCGLYYFLGPKRTNRKERLQCLEKIKSYYKNPEDWDPNNQNHVTNLITKLSARRLYLFYSLTLEKINCKHQEHIAAYLLMQGEFPDSDSLSKQAKKNFKFSPPKDIWLKIKHLKWSLQENKFLQYHKLI